MLFTDQVIRPQALEAAAFITAMYDGDSLILSHQSAATEVKLEAGIRQGDPSSPAFFSAMVGHDITPVLAKWEAKGWGYKGTTWSGRDFRVPVWAYADDITIMAVTQWQAEMMLTDLNEAFKGSNLVIDPGNAAHCGPSTRGGARHNGHQARRRTHSSTVQDRSARPGSGTQA